MIYGACHCGRVTFEADPNGRFLVECNCSICRKLGTVWLHGRPAHLKINAPADSTIAYSWSEKSIAFHSCATCGCTTHWAGLKDTELRAVNMRLAPLEVWKSLPLRHFDGADTWDFLD